jgi:hypothetical protein
LLKVHRCAVDGESPHVAGQTVTDVAVIPNLELMDLRLLIDHPPSQLAGIGHLWCADCH